MIDDLRFKQLHLSRDPQWRAHVGRLRWRWYDDWQREDLAKRNGLVVEDDKRKGMTQTGTITRPPVPPDKDIVMIGLGAADPFTVRGVVAVGKPDPVMFELHLRKTCGDIPWAIMTPQDMEEILAQARELQQQLDSGALDKPKETQDDN